MKYVFGPVTSRRLGRSLGVDPIPLKTCNWNCVYCQLGRSRPLVNERREYHRAEAIAAEVEERLEALDRDALDWVTIVGSGEPLLHSRLGWLIRQIKDLTAVPVAVITNGSLLYLPDVRDELLPADAVLPTLDAGDADLYRRLNRPHPEITYQRLLDGLAAFRAEYDGSLWVEVMLVEGANDGPDELARLAQRLAAVRPDEIHVNLPIRPPAEPWVHPPGDEAIMRAAVILEQVAPVRTIQAVDGTFDLSGCETLADAVLSIIGRHPLSEEEITRTLRERDRERLRAALSDLQASGRARVVSRHGKRFWAPAAGCYPSSGAGG